MLITDKRRPGMLAKADAIIVTRSCFERLMRLQPTALVIPVSFTIEQQSIDFMRSRVHGSNNRAAFTIFRPVLRSVWLDARCRSRTENHPRSVLPVF